MAVGKPKVLEILPGTQTRFHDEDDDLIIEEVQDVQDIIDINKEEYKAMDGARFGEMGKVASIPPIIWQDLIARGIANDNERLKAWLNDPDNRVFRTRPGKV